MPARGGKAALDHRDSVFLALERVLAGFAPPFAVRTDDGTAHQLDSTTFGRRTKPVLSGAVNRKRGRCPQLPDEGVFTRRPPRSGHAGTPGGAPTSAGLLLHRRGCHADRRTGGADRGRVRSHWAWLLSLLAVVGGIDARAQEMPPSRSAVLPVTDNVIHVSAFVPLPPARAWAYFTDNAVLQSWLTAAADVEPRVGGKYELFWQPDDRENNSTIGCRVTALALGQFIAFQWRSPRQFKSFANTADPLTHVVVAFTPEAAGTRVHLVHSGWRSSAEWEEARRWQERAWVGAFAELERVAR